MKGEKFIFRHLWIFVISKNSEPEPKFDKKKEDLYSEVTL